MKCVILVGFLVTLLGQGYGNVLRCTSDGKDKVLCDNDDDRVQNKLPAGKECAPGSTWRSRCNTCTCTPSGYAACTDAACGEQETKPEIRCAANTVWKNDCNTCWCTSHGRAMCTRVGCVINPDVKIEDIPEVNDKDTVEEIEREFLNEPNTSLVREVRAVQEAPYKACQPGQEFRLDCNKCLCDNSGQDFSCTRIDCNAQNNQRNVGVRSKRGVSNLVMVTVDCTPESTFEQGCNMCKCSADGHHAKCTTDNCPQENQVSADVDVSEPDLGFRCSPGEQFRRNCNDCTCSADGRSTFCTLRLCDDDITGI